MFGYVNGYEGIPVSLTLPVWKEPYEFSAFPPVFEGLLPEGPQLEALLNYFCGKRLKLNAAQIGSLLRAPL